MRCCYLRTGSSVAQSLTSCPSPSSFDVTVEDLREVHSYCVYVCLVPFLLLLELTSRQL